MSLTEVLIAMGILTVGLLSVATIFPVGSFYMQKADISDRGSAIAQSVMNDLVARGMLNPRAWYVMSPTPLAAKTSATWNRQFDSDGIYSSLGVAKGATFTRPFALALSEALAKQATVTATDPTLLAKQFGSAYVIDPMGVAMMTFPNGGVPPSQPAQHGPASLFPATAYIEYFRYSGASPSWDPWFRSPTSAAPTSQALLWPIRRVTFRQSSSGLALDRQMADFYFRANDDLAIDLPQRDDRPSMQRFDTTSNQMALARQWTGDYSWIVTVAPTTSAARNGMASNPEGYAYDVSVVVFYKRPLPDTEESVFSQFGANVRNSSAMGMNERVVKASVISTGLNGGELLLTDWPDVKDANNNSVSAYDQLRTGQWIMLCGPHPNSSMSEPRLAMNWYQVLSVESVGALITNPTTQRVVSLRGPQWPWQPSAANTDAANDLCVGICKGAVAVHSKTMRLEGRGSAWSVSAGGSGGGGSGSGGDGGFGSAGNATQTPPPFTAF